ncbi:MAG TPA: FAD-dependent oxidoreductase [Mycobacterium sp.]|nr:FAD-dependent oxidoreductase [Mycobacterium sp.]
MPDCDIAIVGAGPTGLTLTLDLARRGVSVCLFDRAPQPFTGSRGKVISVRTQEIFDDLGLVDKLRAAGLSHLWHRVYLRGAMVRDYDPAAGGAPGPDRPFDYSPVFIPQWRTEQLLRDALAEYGIRPEFSAGLVTFEQEADAVRLRLADGRQVDTSWLIGCDGAHSTVRKTLGLDFAGVAGGGMQGMLLGDVRVDGLAPDRWYQWSDPERGFVALCPFRDSEAWQFQGGLFTDLGPDGDWPEPSVERFQRTLETVARRTDIRLSRPTWLSTWRVNVRMVDRLRAGRVLLAGDAAHVHPPAGGLGMNTGIQDAYNLGWKLGRVVEGADQQLLDSYGEERLPIAAWTLGVSTESLHRLDADLSDGKFDGIAATASRDVHQLRLGYPWSSLAVDASGPVSAVTAGHRAPDALCRSADGTRKRLFDIFRGPHFTLLGFGAETAAAVHTIAGPGSPVRGAVLDDDAARRGYGVDGAALLLVRPDGYVGVTAAPGDVAAVSDYLAALVSPQ